MTASPPKEYRTYEVRDSISPVQFQGSLLAEISNESDQRNRWTEVRLFRTESGRYVLNVIARSVVFHSPTGCATANGERTTARDALDEDGVPCRNCMSSPPIDSRSTVVLEGDRHQTRVFITLAELSKGVNEFGGLGRQALEAAVREGHITATELSQIRTIIL